MQLVVRIRALLAVDAPMRLPFDCPTLKRLAARVDDLAQQRLLGSIAELGDDAQALVDKVSVLTESEVGKLLENLRREQRP